MKTWHKLAIAGAGLAVLGAGVAASGIVPIEASSGHWAITEWMLHFSMRRSVATHSLGIDVPIDVDDPALRQRGAGHYHRACRPCHGTPEGPVPVMVRGMTPMPPALPSRVAELDSAELFYVVRHGVKFTGMPGWPAPQRDDEV